jgi:hypothetical protein
MKLIKVFYCFLVIVLLASSCKKDKENYADIPYVYVDFTIDPMFNNLNNIGDVEVFTGGYRGIIIYRASDIEFMAYERTCTYDPDETCSKLYIDPNSSLFAVDTCCGSTFLLLDGSPTTGPATISLKQYRTLYDAANSKLRVYN